MPKRSSQTRKCIIEAADDLFYSEGIRMVSMDAIAERAGVTKRTLYYHFRSKDDLIAAYLAARDEPIRMRITRWVDQAEGTFAEQVAGMFRKLAVAASSKTWKGCGFLRAAAELAGSPGHPAVGVARSMACESDRCGRSQRPGTPCATDHGAIGWCVGPNAYPSRPLVCRGRRVGRSITSQIQIQNELSRIDL